MLRSMLDKHGELAALLSPFLQGRPTAPSFHLTKVLHKSTAGMK
jgi:hypothetical protein